jgi:hypothetical protein
MTDDQRPGHAFDQLRSLIKPYIDDLEFVYRQGGTLIYFVDSTELKAFLSPRETEKDRRSSVRDFRLPIGLDDAEDDTELAARSDRLVSRLLFETQSQIILQRGYMPETEQTVAHLLREQSKSFSSKMPRMLREANNLLNNQFSNVLKLATDDNLLEIVQRIAPSVNAFIGADTDSPLERYTRIVDDSSLMLQDNVLWEKFGFGEVSAKDLRNLTPPDKLTEDWIGYLRAQRPNASIPAIIADAQSLAFLSSFLDWLRSKKLEHRIRPVLVTRAPQFLHLANDSTQMDTKRFPTIKPVPVLRHPRFLVMQSAGARADQADDMLQTSRALFERLSDYHHSLERPRPGSHTNEIETGLRDAWDKFERTYAALEMQTDGASKANLSKLQPVAKVRELIEEFIRSNDARGPLVNLIDRQFETFQRHFDVSVPETFAQPTIACRLYRADKRLCVMPMVSGVPSAIGFSINFNADTTPDLAGLLNKVKLDRVEGFLARTLVHACTRRWSLAEVHADLAINSANIARGGDRNRAERQYLEGVLLLAQILRLAPVQGDQSEVRSHRLRRYQLAERHLSSVSGGHDDARVARERAAQILDINLAFAGESTTSRPKLGDGIALLLAARAARSDHPFLRVQTLELGVACALVARRKLGDPIAADSAFAPLAKEWRTALEQALDESRGESLAQSRAIEALGDAYLRGPKSTTPRSKLRVGLGEVRAELGGCTGELVKYLVDELDEVLAGIKQRTEIDLHLAPVWAPWAQTKILDLIADPASRALAEEGYQRLGTAPELGEEELSPKAALDALQKAEQSFRAAIDQAQAAAQPAKVRFYLEMEHAYSRLRQVAVIPEGQKPALLRELTETYKDIARRYQDAAVPQFRLSVVASRLGEHAAAFQAAEKAHELLETDPYLFGNQDLWIRSMIQRRTGFLIVQEAAKLEQQIKSNPTEAGALQEQYHLLLKTAFRRLFDKFRKPPPSEDQAYLAQLEYGRRLNNLVYRAAMLLAAAGWSELNNAGLEEAGLRELIAQLHPAGVNAVLDPAVAHTIGAAYAVLNEGEGAAAAGRQVLELIESNSGDLTEDDIRVIRPEAERWAAMAPENRHAS